MAQNVRGAMAGPLDTYFLPGLGMALKQIPANDSFWGDTWDGEYRAIIVAVPESQAKYILTSTSIKPDDPWFKTVFSPEAKNSNVVLIRVYDKKIIWT